MSKLSQREIWYKHVRKANRGAPFRVDDSDIGCRAEMYADIAKHVADGMVAVNVDQMDCDCSRWTSSHVMSAVPMLAVALYVNAIHNDAEGPVYGIWFSSPEQKAKYVSRDLAMEAYEDGHAHSVSMVRYDEDGDYDPTPWCHVCNAMEQSECDCLPIAANN